MMTEKRLFIGRKKCEDRFTIITDYDDEIGVKENHSGDVLVLKHSDLNAQQFVAQLVVFLNDQNQAIVDLYDESKYWSDKATEKIKELEKENEQLKQQLRTRHIVNKQYEELQQLKKGNEQLKQELAIYRKVASCSNCKYHNYDWYDDGDEFEVCDKGNDVIDRICEEWEEL